MIGQDPSAYSPVIFGVDAVRAGLNDLLDEYLPKKAFPTPAINVDQHLGRTGSGSVTELR